MVGNRQTRAHNSVIAFLDAMTWLAQIVMFVLLGLLVWPHRLADSLLGSVVIALVLMLIARPVAVFLCLAPFNYQWREKLFISWVGLRGAVGIFLASIPLLVGLPAAYLFFDVAFVVVLSSLLIQGWTVALAARKLDISFTRGDPMPRRVELDLPGQFAREIVGYPVSANSPFLRRGLIPNWARPTLVVRNEEILTPAEAEPVREGDYVYLLAPPEKAQALDRFFVKMPPPASPDPRLLGDFFVPGDRDARRAGRNLWLAGRRRSYRGDAGRLFRRAAPPQAETGDVVAARPDRAARAQGRRRPRDHRRLAAGRTGRGGRSRRPRSNRVVQLQKLVLERAPRQHRRTLHQPGAAEQHRGPEQIAEHRLVQERQRRDVALHQACDVIGYRLPKAQTAKFVAAKKISEHDSMRAR